MCHLPMASYIYMEKLNKISKVIFQYTPWTKKQEESARERALCQLTECF